jgi:phosphohistidine phosphatase
MKTLYLLRHAKSSWKDHTLDDFDRPLNKRGKHDAPFIAKLLREKGIRPDSILSSPAKRAKKTAKIFSEVLETPLFIEEKLYEADINEMLWIIQKAFETQDEIMIVAHNPELTLLNDMLSDIQIFNIPTTGIVAITFKDYPIDMNKGTQNFFEYPKKYTKEQGER